MQDMNSSRAQFGYFLLADISGFSSHLTKVELEPAGGVLKKLLESVSQNLGPVFHTLGFDTDSVFAFVPEAEINHFESVHRLIEDTYAMFKGNLIEISSHITCNCAACRNVTSLDLKFIIHFGEYILSSVQGTPMLYGLDPTFVRNRRWKDTVSDSVGWRGYILFTEPCMTSLGMDADEFQGEKFDNATFKMIGMELKTNDE